MQLEVHVVRITVDGPELTRAVACLEREELTPQTRGLSLIAGKALLQALQAFLQGYEIMEAGHPILQGCAS